MSKVAIITDTHWGVRGGNEKFISYYEKFYDEIFFPELDLRRIDTVLMLGDTFDSRKATSHIALYHAKKIFFDRLKTRGTRVEMLVGNHDVALKSANYINAPELVLQEYEFNIHTKPTVIDVSGTKIAMIPWICAETEPATMQLLHNTDAKICMGHFEIAGFSMHKGVESHGGLDSSVFDNFDIVFSGHYHHKSNSPKIHYLGNPYELTWNDYKDQRGFHIFDTETLELEFIHNPYTLFHRIDYDDTKTLPNLQNMVLTDCFVKLFVSKKTDLMQYDVFLRELETMGCQDIKIIEDMSQYSEQILDEQVDLADVMSILGNYVDKVADEEEVAPITSLLRGLYIEALNNEGV